MIRNKFFVAVKKGNRINETPCILTCWSVSEVRFIKVKESLKTNARQINVSQSIPIMLYINKKPLKTIMLDYKAKFQT